MTEHDGAYETFDSRFRAMTVGSAGLELLGQGFRWAEGPVWFADLDCLVFSDIPNNAMMRWTPGGGVTTFRSPASFVNGNTRDRQGRLISCSHGERAVLRTEIDGTVTTLVSHHQGKRLNSPNDVVVKSDGSIWFTDPEYGILSDYEGYAAAREQDGNYVYRLDPETGTVEKVAADFVQPNGIAFSPDESVLYVADSGQSRDPDGPALIMAYDVDGERLRNGRVFASVRHGIPDGFRLDRKGNLWTSAGRGINVYAPEGALVGRIHLEERVANLCFGGPRRNRLFITATDKLYGLYVTQNGTLTP